MKTSQNIGFCLCLLIVTLALLAQACANPALETSKDAGNQSPPGASSPPSDTSIAEPVILSPEELAAAETEANADKDAAEKAAKDAPLLPGLEYRPHSPTPHVIIERINGN